MSRSAGTVLNRASLSVPNMSLWVTFEFKLLLRWLFKCWMQPDSFGSKVNVLKLLFVFEFNILFLDSLLYKNLSLRANGIWLTIMLLRFWLFLNTWLRNNCFIIIVIFLIYFYWLLLLLSYLFYTYIYIYIYAQCHYNYLLFKYSRWEYLALCYNIETARNVVTKYYN